MPPGIPLAFRRGMKGGGVVSIVPGFGNVSSNGFGTDLSGSADIVSTGPELVTARLLGQSRKVLSNDS
jgi:hypothetical protein